ncbi:hypothetical protein CLV30_13810 [Haloactinopolyspora alba]|uniref:Uncharacterized protein n=1 Tax=Haloactinopolyspora alba TaxID=648780 RepID=A0A2P8D028_9ACTN|nr:hypothetical protein [Haloactinopolyspora alba]PSK90585.1 hypothetical protein CLV30_13810 [Haloactinopolyspora alba]
MTLIRATDAAVQDWHSHKAWEAALRPMDASAGLETEHGYGVYLEHFGTDEGVRIHVPTLGTVLHVEEDDEQMRRVREVVAQAARALGLLGGEG